MSQNLDMTFEASVGGDSIGIANWSVPIDAWDRIIVTVPRRTTGMVVEAAPQVQRWCSC